MIKIQRLIMIGSTCRNSGKTEFACKLINEFHKKYKIIGLKVSTHYTDDLNFHKNIISENYYLLKESDYSTEKNTARMLNAGACEVYWLQAKIEHIETAVKEFLSKIDKDAYVVCESNSLRKIVEPDLFIMLRNENNPLKKSALDVMKMTDIFVNSNGKEFINFDISNIKIENNKWIFKKI